MLAIYRSLSDPFSNASYVPILIVLTILWYLTISCLLSWIEHKKRPYYLWQSVTTLGILMLFTRSFWQGSLIKIICAAFAYWVLTHERGPAANLSSPLRLRLCSIRSVALSGCIAMLGMAGIFYLYMPFFLGEDRVWSVPKTLLALSITGIFGALVGLLRWRVRKRWPVAVQMSFIGRSGVAVAEDGFYMDEVMVPTIIAVPLLVGFTAVSPEWTAFWSLGIMIIPAVLPLAVFFYLLWAWLHTGVLGWFGEPNKQERMLMDAYDVMLWDDHIQRWLGDLTITADTANNKFILSGALPDRPTLTSIRMRLENVNNAEVDATDVSFDPTMQPDYRRLTAITRHTKRRRAS